ncbi:MAG TPA: trypsin-like peptidase domain-containing protein [Candidatus Binatia bacterium]|nr:trypsin-like peptidase domain-containing protein [Candidatus Binatia bacterium]
MNRATILMLAFLGFAAASPVTVRGNDSVELTSRIWRDATTVEGESELDRLSRAYTRLATGVRPAIVQIRVTTLRPPKPETPQNSGSRGSGFIVHPEGYILTAHHVIDKSQEIEVRLADGQRLQADIVAADAQIDLALLKVQSDRELPTLSLGNSDNISVGDVAVVFGYPFGRESSMNLGIISRAGRSYPDSASYEMIQTDAGAYPGGSGGPLLNGKGHVIGIITMAAERGNMGFATPINVIKRILPRLMSGERLVWGWLGVQMSEISLEQAKTLGLSPVKGVLVKSVLRGQSAELGGILSHDVILSVNDNQVHSPRDVLRMIGGLEAGRVVKVTILRQGKTLQLSVPLGTKPAPAKAQEE